MAVAIRAYISHGAQHGRVLLSSRPVIQRNVTGTKETDTWQLHQGTSIIIVTNDQSLSWPASLV